MKIKLFRELKKNLPNCNTKDYAKIKKEVKSIIETGRGYTFNRKMEKWGWKYIDILNVKFQKYDEDTNTFVLKLKDSIDQINVLNALMGSSIQSYVKYNKQNNIFVFVSQYWMKDIGTEIETYIPIAYELDLKLGNNAIVQPMMDEMEIYDVKEQQYLRYEEIKQKFLNNNYGMELLSENDIKISVIDFEEKIMNLIKEANHLHFLSNKEFISERVKVILNDNANNGKYVVGHEMFGSVLNTPTNCPNCGAPIVSGKCKYCGTHFKNI